MILWCVSVWSDGNIMRSDISLFHNFKACNQGPLFLYRGCMMDKKCSCCQSVLVRCCCREFHRVLLSVPWVPSVTEMLQDSADTHQQLMKCASSLLLDKRIFRAHQRDECNRCIVSAVWLFALCIRPNFCHILDLLLFFLLHCVRDWFPGELDLWIRHVRLIA